MSVILIAGPTQQAIAEALLRHRCHAITTGLRPHEHAPAELRAVARALGRLLDLQTALRGTRRDTSGLQARAKALEVQLAGMAVAPAEG
jgi:hypothetical protein